MTHLRKCVSFSLILISLMGFVMAAPAMVGVARGEEPLEEIQMLMKVHEPLVDVAARDGYTFPDGEKLTVERGQISGIDVVFRLTKPGYPDVLIPGKDKGGWVNTNRPDGLIYDKWAQVLYMIYSRNMKFINVKVRFGFWAMQLPEPTNVIVEPPRLPKKYEIQNEMAAAIKDAMTGDIIVCVLTGKTLLVDEVSPEKVKASIDGKQYELILGVEQYIPELDRPVKFHNCRSDMIKNILEVYLKFGGKGEAKLPEEAVDVFPGEVARVVVELTREMRDGYKIITEPRKIFRIGELIHMYATIYRGDGQALAQTVQEIVQAGPEDIVKISPEYPGYKLWGEKPGIGFALVRFLNPYGLDLLHKIRVEVKPRPPMKEVPPLAERERIRKAGYILEVEKVDIVAQSANIVIRDATEKELDRATIFVGQEHNYFPPNPEEYAVYMKLKGITPGDALAGTPDTLIFDANADFAKEPLLQDVAAVRSGTVYRDEFMKLEISKVDNVAKKVDFVIKDIADIILAQETRTAGETYYAQLGDRDVLVRVRGTATVPHPYTSGITEAVADLSIHDTLIKDQKSTLLESKLAPQMKVGTKAPIGVTLYDQDRRPMNFLLGDLTFASSNMAVAAVDALGTVSALRKGLTVLKVLHVPTGLKSEVPLTVVPATK